MNVSILQSVIYKIILGINDWTLEELQFQKNNPELVERELVWAKQEGPHDIYLSSSQISIAERKAIHQSSPQIKRIISRPTAVLLALYNNSMYEAKVAVFTIDENKFDFGVYGIGDGVFEELYLLNGDTNSNYIQKLQEVYCSIGHIDCLVIVSNGIIDQRSIKEIESEIHVSPQCHVNLNELLVHGAYIYSGVLKGLIRNMLLIQMLPNFLYCETPDKEQFDLINNKDKITSIPTRQTIADISTKSRKLFIKENGSNEPIAVILLSSQLSNIEHHISIETDIDANFRFKFSITDLNSQEKYETII